MTRVINFATWTPQRILAKSLSSGRPKHQAKREQIRRDSLRALTRCKDPGSVFSRKTKRVQRRWALVLRLLTWVREEFFPLSSPLSDNSPVFGEFLSKLQWVVASQGFKGSINWIKSTRLSFLRWLATVGDSEEDLNLRADVERTMGPAVVVGVLKCTMGLDNQNPHFVSGGPIDASESLMLEGFDTLRTALTGLTSLRSFRLPPEIDLSTIESPGVKPEKIPVEWVQKFWKELGVSQFIPGNLKKVAWKKWHFSVRAGPNGPALLSSLEDLVALPSELLGSLRVMGGPLFREVLDHLIRVEPLISDLYRGYMPGQEFTPAPAPMKSRRRLRKEKARNLSRRLHSGDLYDPLEKNIPRYRFREKRTLRKIVAISDVEGKTRVVAILDYFSQSVLRQLHHFAFGILRTVRTDVTFDQGSFLEKIQTWGPDVVYHSVDLTAATDRFPIWVIKQVFQGLLGQGYMDHWERVMTGLPFETPSGGEISYACGNPMGAYSSWPLFALSHHFVVWWACEVSGVKFATARYVLLGDDILIGDRKLAQAYMSILQALGIEYSPAKTFISKGMAEFAKRYLFLGREVTGFPVSSIADNTKSVALLVSAILGEEKKGLCPVHGIPIAIENLDRLLSPGERFATSRNKRKVYSIQAECMYRALRPGVGGSESLRKIMKTLLFPFPWAKEHPELWEDDSVIRVLWSKACERALRKSASAGRDRASSFSVRIVDDTLDRLVKLVSEGVIFSSQLNEWDPTPVGSDGTPLPLVTVKYHSVRERRNFHLWVIPLMGALSRLSATTHKSVSVLLKGHGLETGEWPSMVRSIGYGLPEFLDTKAPDKVLRVVVLHRLAELIISQAKDFVGEEALPVTGEPDPYYGHPQDESSHEWVHLLVHPHFGVDPEEETEFMYGATPRWIPPKK